MDSAGTLTAKTDRDAVSHAPTQSQRGYQAWLSHPLTIVLVSSLLSALFIPWISARMNDRRLIGDARLQRCTDILKNSTETDQRFNSMLTTMEMFIKDIASVRGISQPDREQLRAELARQYLDLDKHAWWWATTLPTEARLLRIEVDQKSLAGLTTEYQNNMIQTGAVLDKLWGACLRKDPPLVLLNQIAGETRKSMVALQHQRQHLIGELVYLFAPKEPTIQRLLNQ
jgi:hypothetical protein